MFKRLPAKRGLRRYRRWVIVALGRGRGLRARTKLIVALLIFAVSFAIRCLQATDVALLLGRPDQRVTSQQATFHTRAISILKGGGLLIPKKLNPSDTGLLGYAPGYPIFLAAVYCLAGTDFSSAQMIQNAVNSISPALIFLISGLLISWRVGVVAGLLAAVSNHLSYYSNLLMADAPAALPLLLAVYILIKARRFNRGAFWPYVMAGVTLSLSVWLRQNGLLLAPFIAVALTIISARRHEAALRLAVMTGVFYLAIAPITIRNYMIYGEFVPVGVNLGIVLWEGIGEASGDKYGAVVTDQEVADQEAVIYNNPEYASSWATPDGIMRDRDRIKKSLDVIINHPFWYCRVMLSRMKGMVNYHGHEPFVLKDSQLEMLEARAVSGRGFAEHLSWLRVPARAAQRVTRQTMIYFILLGAIAITAASRRRALLILIVPLYYLIFQSATHTEFRYTLAMHYFLFIFAAVTWVLIGSLALDGIKRLSFQIRKSERKSHEAI
ncbi:MAG TPA: glycosyltransferase family 39 protein [Blastocatellia bacterium]|nr:glycosyltransferase family 39 protein [Blastocatellia bacterium]